MTSACIPSTTDLLIGTHGRGIWVLDDIAPLEQLASGSVTAGTPYLFRGGQAIQWRQRNIQDWTGSGEFRLPNPSVGARIRYWIPEGFDLGDVESGDGSEGEDPGLEIEILTAMGRDVLTIDAPATPGAHEVLWDFRLDPAYELQPDQSRADTLRASGPTVLPSVYQIRMDVGETTMFGDLTVRQDPRIDISRADLAARQAALMSMYELQAPVYRARVAGRRLHLQLSNVEQLLRGTYAAESFGASDKGDQGSPRRLGWKPESVAHGYGSADRSPRPHALPRISSRPSSRRGKTLQS